MLRLELRCTGPEGQSNGCPEEWPVRAAELHDGVDAIRAAWSQMAAKAEADGWLRGKRDNAFRCPQCNASSNARPASIAGIAYAKWIEALDRFVAGEPPSKWGGTDGLPTARQFNQAIHSGRYPELTERWQQAPTFKGKRKERAFDVPEEQWALVLERFRAGENKAAICVETPGLWPSPKQWNCKLDRDPAFRAAVMAEHQRRRDARAAAIDWEGALALYRQAHTAKEIQASGPTMPNRNEWWRRQQSDPAFRAEIKAAMEGDAYKAAMSAKRNAALVKFYETLAARGWVPQIKRERVRRVKRVEGPKKNKDPGVTYHMRKALLSNDVYAAVDKAVPRWLPGHDRDDIISEMVIDILEGWLSLDALKDAVKSYTGAHAKESGRYDHVSLDAIVPGTDNLRRIDTLDTETFRF